MKGHWFEQPYGEGWWWYYGDAENLGDREKFVLRGVLKVVAVGQTYGVERYQYDPQEGFYVCRPTDTRMYKGLWCRTDPPVMPEATP